MSESCASRSTILPFPSSPHCAPTMTVAGTAFSASLYVRTARSGVQRTYERSSHVLLCGAGESAPGRADDDGCRHGVLSLALCSDGAQSGSTDGRAELPPPPLRG